MANAVVTLSPYQTLVQDLIDQWAANTGTTPTLSPGDPLLAIFEAFAAQSVYIESLIDTVANYGRASTSTGSELDTWMAQFGFTRIAAVAATGPVTLSTAQVLGYDVTIPVGTTAQTLGGAIQYTIIADTAQTAYNATTNVYTIPAGTTSITATVQAVSTGSASNVSANQLTQITSSIPGLATITNATPINNGADAESDSSFFSRWLSYLSSLSKATLSAITEAINSVQTGLDFTILDNTTQTGTTQYGFFTAVVNNGADPPSGALLTSIETALESARAFTVQDTAVAPTIQTITVVITVNLASGTTITDVQTALVNYINTLKIGVSLPISTLDQAALAVTGVNSVKSGTTINGSTNDYTITGTEVIRTVTANVTVNTY